MANISKINQKLTQFGPAPQRTDPANFPARADAMVAHFLTHLDEQNIMSGEYNTTIDEINARAKDIDGKYDEIVEKHTDFIPKYNDAVKKHGQIVTMHEEVEADTSHVDTQRKEIDAIKTHIDERKTQIDADLATAKSLINDGNGGIIDDKKTSAVSTWSSEELKRRFDLKADEATAYKEWNYKTITGAYTAKDNDALFIEASSSFEIQLPAKGKVRIIDKSGNFATHNIRLVSGGDKFVLNKNFQRVELFFFSGKWQIVSGNMLLEKSAYLVSHQRVSRTSFTSNWRDYKWVCHDSYAFGIVASSNIDYSNYKPVVIDLRTMTNIIPSIPSLTSGYTWGGATFADNQLFLVASNSSGQIKLFKFVTSTKSFTELNVNLNFESGETFQFLPTANDLTKAPFNKNIYIVSTKNRKSFKVYGISSSGSLKSTHQYDSNYNNSWAAIANDILFEIDQSNGHRVISCKNMRNGSSISLGEYFYCKRPQGVFIDYTQNKISIPSQSPTNSHKVIEWAIGQTPSITIRGGDIPNNDVYISQITLSRQNGKAKTQGTSDVILEYEAYQSGKPITKRDTVQNIQFVFTSTSPNFASGSRDVIVPFNGEYMLKIDYTPQTFTMEV